MAEPGPIHHTFVFADLSGYTALTEAHGDERAADAVHAFCTEVRARADEYGAEEIKAIGDALMLRVPEAFNALELATRIVGEIGGHHGTLGVRVGMHTGPAVQRGDDWFGATVNLAARVGEAAEAGEVLLTAASRDAIAVQRQDLVDRGIRRFKNVAEPVALFAVTASGDDAAGGLPVDPVCRMAVDPERGDHRHVYRSVEYHFCSDDCRTAFQRQPVKYLRGGRSGDLRVSERARAQTAHRLSRAYTRGRLETHELEARLETAWSARTRADLNAATVDLPGRRGRRVIGPLRLIRARWRRRRSRKRLDEQRRRELGV